jgi:hypothetical protein
MQGWKIQVKYENKFSAIDGILMEKFSEYTSNRFLSAPIEL